MSSYFPKRTNKWKPIKHRLDKFSMAVNMCERFCVVHVNVPESTENQIIAYMTEVI